jgi:hypothetical protein
VKVRVTHLKAPWPPGTQPGDVVTLPGDAIPAWAVNKCEALPEVAPAVLGERAPVAASGPLTVNPAPARKKAQAAAG